MSKKTEPTKLSELLQTEDINEQVKRVESLISASRAPIIHLTIVADTRNGNLSITGTPLDYDMLYKVLDAARRQVADDERRTIINKPILESAE